MNFRKKHAHTFSHFQSISVIYRRIITQLLSENNPPRRRQGIPEKDARKKVPRNKGNLLIFCKLRVFIFHWAGSLPRGLRSRHPDQRASRLGPPLISDHVRLGIWYKKTVRGEGKEPFYTLAVDVEMTIFTRFELHSNLNLMRVSGMAYIKSKMSLDLSKCKQSGPNELLSNCRLTAAGQRITRCVFDEWKRVQNICPLARTHMKRSTLEFFCRDI